LLLFQRMTRSRLRLSSAEVQTRGHIECNRNMKWVEEFKRLNKKYLLVGFLSSLSIFLIGIVLFRSIQNRNEFDKKSITAQIKPTLTNTAVPTLSVTPTFTPAPVLTLKPAEAPAKILFGIGSQAGSAMDYRIVKEAPVQMLTSWYNGTKDLEWMQVQKNDLIPRLYAKGYLVHLITWSDLPEETIQTPYGSACGRAYPVSTQVVEDMRQLAQIYSGPGPMYITLFTEFQTYTCTDNNWNGNENYWKTLKDNFRKIKDIFHANAPNSKVAISWGSWSGRYDDQSNQGGRSLFSHFEDILHESDFNAFQSMQSDSNVQDILDMTRILGSYGKPVMLAHYKPSNHSQDVFNSDMNKIFTDEIIHQLISNGLFAFSFMDNDMLENETSYQIVKNGIQKYGR